jgi:signal transduction histidine kinase
MAPETSFAQFVSLACHDLRTPLATVSGFAHTLLAQDEALEEPAGRYVGMIQAASEQMAELLDDLGLVARIEAGRYQPSLADADTLELAQAAAARLGEKAAATGEGAAVRVDLDAVERALAALALCALRHGALEKVELAAEGTVVWVEPVIPSVAPIILGEDLKDFGAVAARRLVEAIGGSVTLEGERLLVRLPA